VPFHLVWPNRSDRSVPNIEGIFPFLEPFHSTPSQKRTQEWVLGMERFHSTPSQNRTHPKLVVQNFGRPRHTPIPLQHGPRLSLPGPLQTVRRFIWNPTPPHIPLFRMNQSRCCLGFVPPPHPSAPLPMPPSMALTPIPCRSTAHWYSRRRYG
jgi:hypothetical protein